MELSTVVLSALAEWHLHDFPLASTKILNCCSNISMSLLALYHGIRQFSVTIQIQVPSTERSNFFKQIFFLKSFNSTLFVVTLKHNFQDVVCWKRS